MSVPEREQNGTLIVRRQNGAQLKQVAVEGKLIHRSYETKEGEKRYITEIKCNELLMLGK